MDKVCVVIPNWNGVDMIGECLDGLRRQTQKHTTIVVEQASTDGSRELVRDHYPEVQLLLFDDNAGFAGGVNRGIQVALEQGFDYVVLLNNDAVADEHWLEWLVKSAEAHPEVGIVTAKILHMDGKMLDSTGDFYTSWGFSYPRGRGEVDKGQYDSPEQQAIFAGSGGASLYRAEMLEKIGIFDETFFAYFEDVDISFRAQLAGWKVRYEPAARVYHRINATSSRMKNNFMRFHTLKNFVYLYTKNMPGWLYWKYLPKFWVAYGLMFVRDMTRGQAGTFVRAAMVAWGHLPGVLRERWRIQRERRVSFSYIDGLIEHEMPPTQQKVLGLKRWLRLGSGR